MPPERPPAPIVVWRGSVPGDGTGHKATYYVRLFQDGTATCECSDWYMRGLEHQDLCYRCKHVRRAIAVHAPGLPSPPAMREAGDSTPPAAPAGDLAALSAADLRRNGRRARG